MSVPEDERIDWVHVASAIERISLVREATGDEGEVMAKKNVECVTYCANVELGAL